MILSTSINGRFRSFASRFPTLVLPEPINPIMTMWFMNFPPLSGKNTVRFFKITFQDNLNFFLWMNRLYKNISDARPFCSIHVRKKLVSDKNRIASVCAQHFHRLYVIFHRRLMGIFDKFFSHRLIKRGYPLSLIV